MTRIAYLLTQDSGGPVDVTVRLAAALAKSGDAEVRVFGPRPRRGAELIDPFFEETLVMRKGDMVAARQARAALKAWRPDVVHAQDRRSGLVSAALATTGTKIVHTYHGVPDDVAEPWFRNVRGATPPRPTPGRCWPPTPPSPASCTGPSSPPGRWAGSCANASTCPRTA